MQTYYLIIVSCEVFVNRYFLKFAKKNCMSLGIHATMKHDITEKEKESAMDSMEMIK